MRGAVLQAVYSSLWRLAPPLLFFFCCAFAMRKNEFTAMKGRIIT